MPFPPSMSLVTIKGSYTNYDGTPVVGSVTFRTDDVVISSSANEHILPTPVEVPLDANGDFSIQLPATDDPDYTPSDFVYRVVENFIGGRSFVMSAPVNLVNLVANPGAEVDTSGWFPQNCTLSRTTTAGEFRSGVGGFKTLVTASGASSYFTSTGTAMKVVPGHSYSFACWAKKLGTSRNADIQVVWFDANSQSLGFSTGGSPTLINSTGFTQILADGLNAPEGADFAQVRPVVEAVNAFAGETWFFDDIQFVEGALTTVYDLADQG